MRLIDADVLIDELQPNLEIDGKGFISTLNVMKLIDDAPTVETRSYEQGFRDGYSQCITDNEERKGNNRLFQKGGK